MNEAADVLEGVFSVNDGDEVRVAVDRYEWSSPFEVVDVDHVEWAGATDDTWATREVLIEGGYGSAFEVTAIDGDEELALFHAGGNRLRGYLERFEPVEPNENGQNDTSTEVDTSESEAPDSHLEEDVADDGEDDPGDEDGDETATTPREQFAEAVEIYSLGSRITFEDFVDTAEEAHSVFDMQQKLRISRERVRPVLRRLGLSNDNNAFPPNDLRQRAASLREGTFPDDAGAIEQEVGE